jgi:hypothetical protein
MSFSKRIMTAAHKHCFSSSRYARAAPAFRTKKDAVKSELTFCKKLWIICELAVLNACIFFALALLSNMNTSEWEADHAEHNRNSLPDRRCNLGGGIELHAGCEATPHEPVWIEPMHTGY